MSNNAAIDRERIRALVAEALSGAAPRAADPAPQHILVNSLREKAEREWDRDESAKTLLTEDDLRGLEAGSRLRIGPGTKFTPLAGDLIRERGIELITRTPREAGVKVKSLAIGADHGGFRAKEALKEYLSDLGVKIRDAGTDSEEAVDYPDIAHAVASLVGAGHVDAGILIDGAGIGSAMAANKVPGVRAAACYSEALARNAREHNGANVLTLGSGQNSLEELKQIVTAFLSSEITEDRHKRRVAKIGDIDRQYRK
jgi:ribose 5-phosphate isomerase B